MLTINHNWTTLAAHCMIRLVERAVVWLGGSYLYNKYQ